MASQNQPQKIFKADQQEVQTIGLEATKGKQELSPMCDSLLQNFSLAQKSYIIENLYPELSRALVHFISEAKRHNQIDEVDTLGAQVVPAEVNEGIARRQSTTFAGYKLGVQPPTTAQPSNMQLNNSFAKAASPDAKIQPAQRSVFNQNQAPTQIGSSSQQIVPAPAANRGSAFGGYSIQQAAIQSTEEDDSTIIQARSNLAETNANAAAKEFPLPVSSHVSGSTLNKSETQFSAPSKQKTNNRNSVNGQFSGLAPPRTAGSRASQSGSLVQKYEPVSKGRKDGQNKFIKNAGRGTATRPQTSKTTQSQSTSLKPSGSQRKVQNSYARIQTNSQPLVLQSIQSDRDDRDHAQNQMVFSPNRVQDGAFKNALHDRQHQTPKPTKMVSNRQSIPNASASAKAIKRGGSQSALKQNQTPSSALSMSVYSAKKSKFSESVLNQKKNMGANSQAQGVKITGVYRVPTAGKTSYQPKTMSTTPLTSKKKATKFLSASQQAARGVSNKKELITEQVNQDSIHRQKMPQQQEIQTMSNPPLQNEEKKIAQQQDSSNASTVQKQSSFGTYKMQTSSEREYYPDIKVQEVPDTNTFGQVNINVKNIEPQQQKSTFSSGFAFGSGAPSTVQNQEKPTQNQAPALNYQNFAMDKKRTASLPVNTYMPSSSLKGSFQGFQMNKQEEFKAVDQFRISLAEVTKTNPKSRIFNQAAPGATPNADYLNKKRSSVFHKAFDSGAAIKEFVPPVYSKPQSTEMKLVQLFTNSFLTKNIDNKNHLVLSKAMFSRNFTRNQKIISYGDMGSEYFVLGRGKVRVTVYKPGADPKDPKLDQLVAFEKILEANYGQEGASDEMIGFGEIALLYNDKRTASITAITDCETWVLSGDVFKHIIAANSIRRRNISLEYLDKVELFKCLEQFDKLRLIDGLKVVQMDTEEYVFHQGDRGEHFYVIEEGQIECGFEKELPDGTSTFELVRTLQQGEHFGEIALINNVKRTLAVRASQPTQLLSLTRSTFNRILGSIKQLLKEDYTQASERGGPQENGKIASVDGSFLSEQDLDLSGHKNNDNSFLSNQKLFGIQEQDEYEDPLNSDRQLDRQMESTTAGVVQPQRKRR